MTQKEALNTLMKMRAWRAWGKEQKEKRPEMPEQKEVDEAFDVCIKLLQQSSLPSNLDEAAKEYLDEVFGKREHHHFNIDLFKAGAEWMAGQGYTFTSAIDYYDGFFIDSEEQEQEAINELGLKVMDKVIIQIRKK